MSGGKAPAQTTQVTKVELPAWVDSASQENYGLAKDLSTRPYQQYTGPRQADLSPETTGAWDFFNNQVAGSWKPGMAAANNTVGGLLDYNAGQVHADNVKPELLAGKDLSPYLNPYTDEVENRALDALDRSRNTALMGNSDNAIKSKSFGGSRSAIVDALTNSESIREAGDLSASLRGAGFDKAMGLLGGDVDRQNQSSAMNADSALRARLANQQADLASAGVRSNAANQSAAFAQQTADLGGRDYLSKLGIGQTVDQRNQQAVDTKYQDWMDWKNYPEEQLNMRLAALGMSPYGKTETSSKTGTSENKGTDWATVGAGLFNAALPFIFSSDDDMKTDKQKMGTDPDTGLDIWAYRYKGDPKSYPKVVGLMASDVEKKVPSAVKRMPGKGGKRAVDYRKAMSIGGWH